MQIRKIVLASWQLLAVTWALVLILALVFNAHFLLKHGIDYDQSHLYPVTQVDDARIAAQNNLAPIANYRLIFMVGFPEDSAASFDDNVLKLKAQWTVPNSLTKVKW